MHISLHDAALLLQEGRLVAIPTETVYGLACSMKHPCAIGKIFSVKGRSLSNPLIIHVYDVDQVMPFLSAAPADFLSLAKAFWPGPLTLVMPIYEEKIPSAVRAHLPTAAFRVPSHPITRQIIEKVGPICAPSANLSGHPSPTQVAHVGTDFGADFPVIDGGASAHGVESTILIWKEGLWWVGRKGAITEMALHAVLGYIPEVFQAEKPLCPGQLFRHYSPETKLTLTKNPQAEYVVGFSDRRYADAIKVFSLGNCNNAEECAAALYSTLRQLDQEKIKEADVDSDMPQDGLWATVRERLERAASR